MISKRLALFLSVFAFSAFGQSGAGSIQGTVSDTSSAPIPTCTIQVLNQATGVSTDTACGANGFYSARGLFAGSYRVSFASCFFMPAEATVTR